MGDTPHFMKDEVGLIPYRGFIKCSIPIQSRSQVSREITFPLLTIRVTSYINSTYILGQFCSMGDSTSGVKV